MIELEVIIGLALLKALALIVTMTCLDFYKVLGYDLWIDLAIGFGLLAIYHGSAHGMLIATMAGVIVTVVLRFFRWFMGYKRYSFVRMQWEYHPY